VLNHRADELTALAKDDMKSNWTKRGIRGTKYLAFGLFSIMAFPVAMQLVSGSRLGIGIVQIILGGIGPLMLIPGIYLVATRDKKE
jgi:hypothetical protein